MKKASKKILAICTVLTLVLSVLAGTLGASASTAGENTFTVVPKTVLPEGTNLLSGKIGQAFAPFVPVNEEDDGKEEFNDTTKPEFTDNNVETKSYVDILYRARESYLIYDLGGKYDITNVFLLSRTENLDYCPMAYDICVANTREGLFEESAVKASFTNTEKEAGQYFTFAENAIPSGRYVAFKFPKHMINFLSKWDSASVCIRLAELGVYGAPTRAYQVRENITAIPAEKTNLIAGQSYIAVKDSKGTNLVTPPAHNNPTHYTDGKIGNGNSVEIKIDGTPYFIYDLGGVYTIDELLLLSRNMSNKDMTTKAYNIRVANTESGLFEDDSCKVSYYNTNKENYGQLFTFADGSKPTGRYVAFGMDEYNFRGRATDSYIRLDELGVYGSKATVTENYSVSVQQTIPEGKTNLIAGKQHAALKDGYGNPINVTHDSTEYTNGRVGNEGSFEVKANVNTCLIYDLGRTYAISDFLLLSRDMVGKKYFTTKSYNIRVAETEEGLFKEDACKVAYINPDQNTYGHMFSFAEGEEPVGRYIAFEIVDPTFEGRDALGVRYGSWLRIDELGVYGEKVKYTYDYNDDAAVDILDLIRLKKYAADPENTEIDLTVCGEYDVTEDSAAALTEFRKSLLR